MATYRIVCTVKAVCTVKNPSGPSRQQEHIVAVGVDDGAKTVPRWTLTELLAAMNLADIFYTRGNVSGTVALVQKYTCTQCGRVSIQSATDAVTDNNLDSLPQCP
jgi:hypothetical protein